MLFAYTPFFIIYSIKINNVIIIYDNNNNVRFGDMVHDYGPGGGLVISIRRIITNKRKEGALYESDILFYYTTHYYNNKT